MVKMIEQRSRISANRVPIFEENTINTILQDEEMIRNEPHPLMRAFVRNSVEIRNVLPGVHFDSSIELSDHPLTPDKKDLYEEDFVTSEDDSMAEIPNRMVLLNEIRRMRDGIKQKNWLTWYKSPHSIDEHTSPRKRRLSAKRVALHWIGASIFPVIPYNGKRRNVTVKPEKASDDYNLSYRGSRGFSKSYRSQSYSRNKVVPATEPRAPRRKSRLAKDATQMLRARRTKPCVKMEPESPSPTHRNFRTVFRSMDNSFIEPPSENTPNKKAMGMDIINLLTPEPNPNPRA